MATVSEPIDPTGQERTTMTVNCFECEQPFESDDLTATTSGAVCRECVESSYVLSGEGALIRTDDAVPTPDGYLPRDDCERFGGIWYTRVYLEGHTFTCESCDEVHWNGDYAGDGQCIVCADNDDNDDDASGEVIEEYHSVRAERRYGYLNEDRITAHPVQGTLYFGVELEVECPNDREEKALRVQAALPHVVLQYDGSLDNGFEIITAPAVLSAQRRLWKRFTTNVARGLKSHNTSTCGMHVHVSRDALTPLQIGKLTVFLNAGENYGFVTTVSQRVMGTYCKQKSSKASFKNGPDVFDRSDRYDALNLVNENTVEFRIFRGNTRADRILKNLEFCAALIAWTKTASLQALSFQNFLAWLTKPEQRTEYSVLYAFLCDAGVTTSFIKPKPAPKQFSLNVEGLVPDAAPVNDC
jgi:hypothetical protein